MLVISRSARVVGRSGQEDHKPHVPSEQERIEGVGRVVVQHTVPSSIQADGTTDIISKVQLSLSSLSPPPTLVSEDTKEADCLASKRHSLFPHPP